MQRGKRLKTSFVPLALLAGAIFAQSGDQQALDATVHVRVISLGTEEPLAGVWVWAGRKPFDWMSTGLFDAGKSLASEAFKSMEGVGEILQTGANGEVELRVPSGHELWVVAMNDRREVQRLDPLAHGARAEVLFRLWSSQEKRYLGLVRERTASVSTACCPERGSSLPGRTPRTWASRARSGASRSRASRASRRSR